MPPPLFLVHLEVVRPVEEGSLLVGAVGSCPGMAVMASEAAMVLVAMVLVAEGPPGAGVQSS